MLQRKRKPALVVLSWMNLLFQGSVFLKLSSCLLLTSPLQTKISCHFSGAALSLLSATFTSTKGHSTVAKVTAGPFIMATPQPRWLHRV